jgi:hypothetical protein
MLILVLYADYRGFVIEPQFIGRFTLHDHKRGWLIQEVKRFLCMPC